MKRLALRRRPPPARIFRLALLVAVALFLETDLSSVRFQLHADLEDLETLGLEKDSYSRSALTAPSFNGRTADSGSAYRGSNPWGAANTHTLPTSIEPSRTLLNTHKSI
jgi:hypothetical protein